LDEADLKRVEASFAQIKSKDDYEHVISYLKEIANRNVQSFPTFAAW